jgi:predicted nuclease with RNAse H fold
VLISGVDLAAEPKGTVVATIDWSSDRAELVDLQLGVDDQQIMDACANSIKVGIDCALGWPVDFIEFLNRHSDLSAIEAAPAFDGGSDLRRNLAHRETDRHVREVTGRWPLSVSTDRLGMTAIRCAGLLSKWQAAGTPIDRTGAGKIVEIYPGASLRLWGFDTAGYRSSETIRATLLAEIKGQAPWLSLAAHEPLMLASCDAFDAVIAALAARSAHLGRFNGPKESQRERAKIEGWVALPQGRVRDLIGGEDQ